SPCLARPKTVYGSSLRRDPRPGGTHSHDSRPRTNADRGIDGSLAQIKAKYFPADWRYGVPRNFGNAWRRTLESLVSDQQEFVDQFVCPFQRRVLSPLSRAALLADRIEAVAREMDHADSRLRHECHRRFCR